MRLLSALFLAGLSFAGELPSGESILARSVVEMGGRAALARVKGARMTGTVEVLGHNLRGPVSVFQQGDKTYTVIELPGVGKIEEGFDGETAWEVNALTGPRIKEGEEKSATVRASKLGMMNTWREYYSSAKTVGEEDVAGRPAWKVQLLPKEGKPELFFFDQESGLLVRMTQTISTPLGDIPVDGNLSDYRAVDGIMTPFTMTQNAMSQTLAMHFDHVDWNPVIPSARFELPAAVRSLAGRGKP